ncbi:MGH1-like glycoside hydrolase domain-containing protein [Paenibacillus cymbidii]|uniref:MGH1-like glycoside hydrolase domain-containing protein n=1 Tax=Paenibacillus cymbidii TaxID=1639034 RepID=UPI001080FA96|nr:trehalase family glycosidase [Paenibacillus cymbidii]
MQAYHHGYRKVLLTWRQEEEIRGVRLYRMEEGAEKSLELSLQLPAVSGKTSGTMESAYIDIVPKALSRTRYMYTLEKSEGSHTVIETAATSFEDWCEPLLPRLVLPAHPDWLAVYRKAWQLAWSSIVMSDALPVPFAYNDYPDNNSTYLWDSCFCSLYHRYAALQEAHPCMGTLDNFYAKQQEDGYIVRVFNWQTYEAANGHSADIPAPEAVNPPLLAWAEWQYYQTSGDLARLRAILPKLVLHYQFIHSFLEEQPGRFRWDGDGSGWDNINWNQDQDTICWYVDMLGQQALAARMIASIAGAVEEEGIRKQFEQLEPVHKEALRPYWNEEKGWYCSLTADGRFTRKTLSGIWPLLAGLTDKDQARRMVKENLLNPAVFLSEPLPLPVLAKDEPGYNPLGEYWLGGVWINMSLAVVKALDENGFGQEALELARRTLQGVADVYHHYEPFPYSLWECYAPEHPAPASHKIREPNRHGGVRREFGGWTGNVINLLIEHILGIAVDAPKNRLRWQVRLQENQGIENLRFGKVCTDVRLELTTDTIEHAGQAKLTVASNSPYELEMVFFGETRIWQIQPGTQYWAI